MKELTLGKRIEWFEATLKKCCSSANTLNDEQFLSALFEELSIDAVSCFSEYSLNVLVNAGILSEDDKIKCFRIRDLFMANENNFRVCSEPVKIKAMRQWKEINEIADVVWNKYCLNRKATMTDPGKSK